ncbi:hypothetical protein [uncultured Robinsoniella sp.]
MTGMNFQTRSRVMKPKDKPN